LAAALLAVYLHSLFEWVFVTFPAQYLLALDIGLVAALAQSAIRPSVSEDGPATIANPARSVLVRQYGTMTNAKRTVSTGRIPEKP
jgi:hypothetical protein